ncbi:MAG TPA: 2OG-Fe(II) oxygenase [Vicinamibacterales bacterium]|nr:2OG-Fe(II) oxygenase [Vicinamibacterales bacterium]
MLQLTRAAFVCTEPPEALDAMRRSFEAAHVIRLPRFVDPELLELVRQTVRRAHFSDREDEGFAREACMDHDSTLGLLFLVMNDPKLFDVIRRITGCAPIGSFAGRIYLMRAGEAHHRWHSDVDGTRLIGISVNLTEHVFEGGRFELRHAGATNPEWSFTNAAGGDAILFRIAADLQHRVTDVEGDVPRIAFAGWFQSAPDFHAVLKQGAKSAEKHEVY